MSTVRETLAERQGLAREEELPALSERLTVIQPASRIPKLDFQELWQYRELALTFVWRDLKVRYKQTAIGVAWALLQPFVTMVVLTLIFGKFAKFPSQNLPYPVFLYSAQLPWTYFSSAFVAAAASISLNATLVTKIYFPRVLLPLAAITVPFVDFVLASSILAGMMVWYHVGVGPEIVLAPLFILMAAVTALGAGFLFAVANVRYRDVPYVIPFLVQIWFYLLRRDLPDRGAEGEVAVDPVAEPDDRRDHRLPLGARRHAAAARGPVRAQRRHGRAALPRRADRLPRLRAALRGHDLMAPSDCDSDGDRGRGSREAVSPRAAAGRLRHAARLDQPRRQPHARSGAPAAGRDDLGAPATSPSPSSRAR